MNIEVKVDGKVCYSDRTFKIGEAFDLLQIALTEGQIPDGHVTSVTLRSEGPYPRQIISKTEDAVRSSDDGVVYDSEVDKELDVFAEEEPAVDVFMEGRACAV